MITGDGNEMMSIYSGVCQIYTPCHSVHLHYPYISVQPPSLLGEVLVRACLRCTWRRRSSELRDALGVPGSSEFGDALGGHDRANLQAVIEQVWICTWRLKSSEIRDALGGQDRASLEMHLEAMMVRTCKP